MGFGITTFNNAGGLTLSSDGSVYSYVGVASLVAVSQPPDGDISEGFAGYSTYTITWPADIIVALPVKTNGGTALLRQEQSGSVWTITVHKSTGVTNGVGFDVQEATEVYVFGAPTSVSGHGLALYNASGEVSADLSRVPLVFDCYAAFAAGTSTAPVSGLTTPAVIGIDPRYAQTNLAYDGTFYDNRLYYGSWAWSPAAGGLLVRQPFQSEWVRSVSQYGAANFVPATTAILVDVATLV